MKTKLLALVMLVILPVGYCKSDEIKVLNNLVSELLNTPIVSEPYAEYSFYNPREGWVFVSSTADIVGPGKVRLALDSKFLEDAMIVHKAGGEQTLEAMRLLSAGEHKVSIWCEGSFSPGGLIVRAIPELVYTDADLKDWEFLEKNILKNITTMFVAVSDKPPTTPAKPWKQRGKKWIGNCGIQWKSILSLDDYKHWTGYYDKNPCLNGVVVDEFPINPSSRNLRINACAEKYVQWSEAIEKIYAEKKYKDKVFYAYAGSADSVDPQRVGPFIKTLMKCNYRISIERYMNEKPTEAKANQLLGSYLRQSIRDWKRAEPGVEKHMIINLGVFSKPPASLNKNPGVNFKVWMDMQVNMIVNDREFSGIDGLQWWTSSYADEETNRWIGKLYRHYAIEGQTEMLSKDPYILTHIENSDFKEGTKGWTLTAAEEGSIEVKSYKEYGKVQGRYDRSGHDPESDGDEFLWMKRNSKKQNLFSQQIKDLEPGRLYSMKMIVTDYEDLIAGKSEAKEEQKFAVNIKIEGAEIDANKQTVQIYKSHRHVPGIWLNYHWLFFRAKGETAKLLISDWASEKEPTGPIGQELIYNFIEIQPYLNN